MSFIKNNRTKGFSFIEVLVYIAVLVLISVTVVSTFLALDTSLLRNKAERALTNSAQVTLERMVRDIRAGATADTTIPGQLTLNTAGFATTTVFVVSGGNVTATVNGTNLGPLTSDDVTVENLVFTKYSLTGTELETDLVRVALTLSISTKAASTTKTYYTSAVLRGSYE